MLDQMTFDQIQITPLHDLSPLLTHPDFHQGLVDAQERFLCDYVPAPLSLDQMIYEIEICVSSDEREQSKEECLPYFYWLGYAYGIINEGLTYTSTTDTRDDLSVLLSHPDFLQGVNNAQSCFPEWYDPAPLTLDQMVTEVEGNLGRVYKQSARVVMGVHGDHPSYIHHMGFVFGIINEGLTYTIG